MPLPHEIPFNARTYYSGNGSNTDFLVTFTGGAPLATSHVEVYLNNVKQTAGWSIVTVSGSNYVRFTTAPTAAVGGIPNVLLRRVTPKTAATRMIDFTAGSLVRADDLDTAQLNALYVAQEASDDSAAVVAATSGTVLSVFGRDGVVTAQAGDYDASLVANCVTSNTTQTISGAKTFSSLVTANAGVSATTVSASSTVTATGNISSSGTVFGAAAAFNTNTLVATGNKVGVNTNNPQAALQVVKWDDDAATNLVTSVSEATAHFKTLFSSSTILTIGDIGSGACYIQRSNGAGSTPYDIHLNPWGGNIGIGLGTTAPSHVLHISGQGRSTNSAWATSSDARVKTDIAPLADGLSKILALNPVSFTYTPEYAAAANMGTDTKRGFIAQEAETVLPGMVQSVLETFGGTTYSDFRVLNTSDLVPTLVAAIKDLKAIVDAQAARISALESAA